MAALVSYTLSDGVATVAMDDGKVNALSPAMLGELGDALDHAQSDGAPVVLTGRAGVFSAGFDLRVLTGGGGDARGMLRGGFELAARLLSFPTPVVIACNGHAVAMGVFLLCSGDYRIGVEGAYRITANEVAIGLTMPLAAVELCRHRLAPAHMGRALLLAETFSPTTAVAAGFLDRTVDADALLDEAVQLAAASKSLDLQAHAASKLRVRGATVEAIRAAADAEFGA